MKFFHAFLLFLLLSTFVFAQEEDETEDVTEEGEAQPQETEEVGQTTAADGVTTSYIFPDHQDVSFPAGKVVEALIGFENKNENDFQVEYIRGSLTSPTGFTFYIQNFTGALHNSSVPSGSEVTLVYRFKADASIDPREYGLLLEVFYTNDENETYLSTVFNSTVTITDPETVVDAKTVFAYLTIVGIIGLVVYVVHKALSKSKPKRSQPATRGRTVEAGAPQASNDDIDWDFIPAHLKKRIESPERKVSPTRKSPPRSPK